MACEKIFEELDNLKLPINTADHAKIFRCVLWRNSYTCFVCVCVCVAGDLVLKFVFLLNTGRIPLQFKNFSKMRS